MMTSQPIKYNPSFLSQEELIRTFVVRHVDFDLIMEVIRENTGLANQHILVVGPRGAGKTTLALRAAAEVRQNKEFSNLWYPVVFAEESYEVCSPGEFWLAAIFHLSQQTQDMQLQKVYEELRGEKDESRLRERALAQLMDFADKQGKRLLLVVENMNMLLGQQVSSEDAWALRHTLLNESNVMLLGTATSRFEEHENADRAMFELFKIHELKPLDSDGCRKLWSSITGQDLPGDRIRPMEILTGGNPRLLVIISSFAAKTSFRELMDDLTRLVDEHTEYFKSHLDGLPALERKVFVALADLWHPSTARQIADSARIDVNKTSANLKRLISKGAVVEADQEGRKKWYQVAERMYNIYHLMRRRGGRSSWVRALVDFMVHFYPEEDLAQAVVTIATEACELSPERRVDHCQFLEGILKTPQAEKFRERIFREIPKEFFAISDLPASFREMGVRYDRDAAGPAPSGIPTEEEMRAVRPENAEDPMAWVGLAKTLMREPGSEEAAEKACLEAIKIDPKNEQAWMTLGMLFENLGRYEKAEESFRTATEITPGSAWAWMDLGRFLEDSLQRYEEAERAFRKAIGVDPNNSWAWINLGGLLWRHLERYGESEEAFKKAIEKDPNHAWARVNLGDLLSNLERYEEAEEAFNKAVEIDSNHYWAWVSLGDLLAEKLRRYEEAEEAYRKATAIDPEQEWAWVNLGGLLRGRLNRHQEAEEVYRKAIAINPGNSFVWANIGYLLSVSFDRYKEAEEAYRKAIEIDPNYVVAWHNLGSLLRFKLGRYEEAEQAYKKAIQIDPDYDNAWMALLALQMDVLDVPDQALQTAERFAETSGRSGTRLNILARAFLNQNWNDHLEKAEKWIREAVQKEPEKTEFQLTLASVLGAAGRWDEAFKITPLFLADEKLLRQEIKRASDLFINAAASGYAENALHVLKQHAGKTVLEPLVVGIKIFLGEKVRTAQEIKEVGEDVAKRIRERLAKNQVGLESKEKSPDEDRAILA